MSLTVLVYTLAFSASCVYFMRFSEMYRKVFTFILLCLLVNLPLFYGLSVTEWLDSILGRPSLFLLFLSLSACFVIFFAPKEIILPLRSKIFIVIFGFVVFLGNLNLLWGFDLFSLDFKTQLIVVLGILFFAFALDAFLGLLYLFCLIGIALGIKGNIITDLIDVSVWIYALGWTFIGSFTTRKTY